MAYFFYRLLTILFSPVLLAYIFWLALKNKSSRYLWQRLGFNYSDMPTGCRWFHCASVGEVNTLLPLLKNIHQHDPQAKFIITTNTVTGAGRIKQLGLDYLLHSYLPFDWLYAIKCFLFSTQPTALYVMETELWPNLFTVCHRQNIPVIIINARLSSKTTNANGWIKSLLKYTLSHVSAIHARSENDAQLFKELGANDEQITTTGNLKLSTAINTDKDSTPAIDLHERDYVLIASTHSDEEKQIHAIWQQLGRDELLIIAPRHPERADSIIKELKCKNLAQRSKNEAITKQTEVFLLDSIGELNALFNDAVVVVMGGSFVSVGGHNILEPANCNRAIITGPYMENFSEELKLMQDNDAIIQISEDKPYVELKDRLSRLLEDTSFRSDLENNTRGLSLNAKQVLDDYTTLIIKPHSR